MTGPSRILTPREIFEARIEQLRKEGSGVSVRNVAERLNLSIKKDSIHAMLSGDGNLKWRPESYRELARGLEIDEFKIEAALAWHLMSEEARSALCDMLGRLPVTPGSSRSRLVDCLNWIAPQARPLKAPHGWTEVVLSKDVRFLFIYADELSPAEVSALAARPDPAELLRRVRTIFLVVPESWSEAQKLPFDEKLSAFKMFVRVNSIEEAKADSEKHSVFCTDQTVLDWNFRERFEPTTYIQNRRAKFKSGPLHAPPELAPLKVRIGGAEPQPAEKALLAWCRQPPDAVNLMTLEGGYGTGKSTILKNVEQALTETVTFATQRLEHIPIVVQARNWIPRDPARLFEWLRDHIFTEGNFGRIAFDLDIPREVFEALCAARTRFILLVDGLDEVVRSAETLHSAMEALRWFAALGNRVIVATRPEVFIDQSEVDRELTHRLITRAAILPVEPNEVDKYLVVRLDGEALKQVQELRERKQVSNILERPIFLSHICEVASEDPARLSRIHDDNPYDLFELLTNEWLERESFQTSIFKKKHSLIIEFLREMAIELSARHDGRVVDIEMSLAVQASLDEVTRTLLRGHDFAPEEEVREARVCSFVTVDETADQRRYEFNLRPFKSYFLAETIVDELGHTEWSPQTSKLGRMRFEFDDLEFIASGLRGFRTEAKHKLICERLIEAIRFTAAAPSGRLGPHFFLGGNAATIYAAINGNRLDLDLTGVSLAGMMLSHAEVLGRWRAVDLSEATLSDCDLSALEARDIYAVGATISRISDNWPRIFDIAVPQGLIGLPSGQVELGWGDMPALPGFVLIPPGQLELAGVENPIGHVLMHAVYVAETSVTNETFRGFLTAHPQWRQGQKAIELIERDLRETGSPLGSQIHYLSDIAEAPGGAPVVYVPRTVMAAFCQATGSRLPSEAEWEYAFVASVAEASGPAGPHSAHPVLVDTLVAAKNGIKGMHRQVREMCADCYWHLEEGLRLMPTIRPLRVHPFFRPAQISKKNTQGLTFVSPAYGVVRGTSAAIGGENSRSARDRYALGNMDKDVGFRPVVDLAPGLARALDIGPAAAPRDTPGGSATDPSSQSTAASPMSAAAPREIPNAH